MSFEEFKIEFLKQASKNNISVTEKELNELYQYMNGVIEWNDKINVTAITDEKLFIVKHFIDSLLINQYLEGKESLIDIGTGGGFPGIPLKILNEDVKFTLTYKCR